MFNLTLVGIGAGNPRHLTLQAIDALNAADVILIPRKGPGKDDLAGLRRQICTDVLRAGGPRIHEFDLPVRDAANPDYRAGVDDWHDAIADTWQSAIRAALPQGGTAAFMVWGDPALYDSTLRIADRLRDRMPVTVTVIPGLTAIAALTAGHAIALNEIGAPFVVTTGRQLRENGWPQGVDTAVVMLDGGGAFQALNPDGLWIWWSAYAGMENEIRIAGPLAEVADKIIATRQKARADHGWIMDIYLLRRSAG
ncbi:precorrin-6A synthase (deacetylating) [Actibacterium sp. XHP0104]|uniref:precorrin-6A synthase (deacetylating) n=1 Tax=Actibacterium sp. XHP0104 TaxID=2984335 RepID=UPI0021E7A349|nr:precorrin-6A synthase (deacetylating) [Actibacterium sp. XHP0104]MCV2882706.1 precorrin-6A synthase (deacetylating) [Actibacterium sp. XHP0104]